MMEYIFNFNLEKDKEDFKKLIKFFSKNNIVYTFDYLGENAYYIRYNKEYYKDKYKNSTFEYSIEL